MRPTFPNTLVPVALRGAVRTDAAGYAALVAWFEQAWQLGGQNILLDVAALKFLDANQCALLRAMIYECQQAHGGDFGVDAELIKSKFRVLLQNGFVVDPAGLEPGTTTTTSVQMRRFEPTESSEFWEYLTEDLFGQPDLQVACREEQREEIISHLLELFSNVELHANAPDKPIFACGQYYPKPQQLRFTLVDLGGGYLPPIQAYTSRLSYQGPLIMEAGAALRWAVAGRNSTANNRVGGMGLKSLLAYCVATGGELHIASGGQYLTVRRNDDGQACYHLTPVPFFQGSAIHVVFNCA